MTDNLTGAVWRLAVFVAVCLLAIFASLMVFAQLRFGAERHYRAEFTNVTGLQEGNFVRIAGVEVGKVKNISLQPDATVMVEFSTDDTVPLTEATTAVVRYADLIGGRYLELAEGAAGARPLEP
ncbi:MlaD family protein, partial [Micromonospora sp. WMMD736]|uniref:MlaD family protein n=1 Tax=Micromonospora sp. WMMD736 TaxID=3404112 RepID=UPI003B951CFA